MQNTSKHVLSLLSFSARAIMVFMLILPAGLTSGLAQAKELSSASSPLAPTLSSSAHENSPNGANPKILVNEFYRAGTLGATGDEWLELLLIQDMSDTDLQSFFVGDSTSSTEAKYSAYQFSNMSSIATIFPKGTIIVVAGGATSEDTSYDPSSDDWDIILTTNGAHITAANSNGGDLAGTDVAWVDTVSTGSTISADGFAVNWDSTPGSLGAAADVTITPPINNSGAVLTSDLLEATSAGNWMTSVLLASLTMGQPNGGDNTAYIEDLRGGLTPPVNMTISKASLDEVLINETFNYTLTVNNDLGEEATQVVITDSLPAEVSFVSASDDGVLLEGTTVVSWSVPTIADATSIERTITVTAPDTAGTVVNDDYRVSASNFEAGAMGSPVSTIVSEPSAITPIATARAGGVGWKGTVQGSVTHLPGTYDGYSFSVQDGTGGLYIYSSASVTVPTLALGDVVQVKGTMTAYHGLLELGSIEDVTWVSSGAVPDPLVTPSGNVGPTQGWLVEVTGGTASWTGSPPAPGASNWSFNYDDGSGTVSIFIDKDTHIDMTGFTSPMPMRVIGISSAYDAPQINPRTQSDIIDLRPPEVVDTVPADEAEGVSLYYPLTATFNKPMAAATINSSSFTLEDSSDSVSGAVGYDAATHTASFTPDAPLSALTSYTATLTADIKDIYDIALTDVYTWVFSTGVEDETLPAIELSDPAPDETGVSLSANVVITFTEDILPSTMDLDHFSLASPYGLVPFALSYDAEHFAATLNPNTSLLGSTTYTVTVKGTIEDWAHNAMGDDSQWQFETMPEPEMSVYFGDLHNHTSISDGAGTPAQALAAGKAAGFDFMAITDHSYSIDDTEWATTLSAVDAATDSSFVALRGFEYTQGAEGHINVYNTVRHAVRTDTTATCTFCDYTPNLDDGSTVQGFYTWVTISGTVGLEGGETVLQFNHPGWINFNDWEYHPEVSDVARLEEVGNGTGSSYTFSEDQYIRSLDYGWKLGATNNADTHTAYWGVNTDARTGVVMPELTKDALLEALHARRTFATEDKNFSLTMKANGLWMGSEITNIGQVAFTIDGSDPDGELTSLVQIITNQGKVALQYAPGTADFSWTPTLDVTAGIHYFYVKVTQADGDRIVSSPVWTQGSEDIAITDLTIQPTIPTIYNPSLITVRVTNRNDADRVVSVDLTVGLDLVGTVADLTVPGHGDAFANFSWQPTEVGDVTLTAQLTGAPADDNPDDNEMSLDLTVTDVQVPLILIDAGKGNLNATGNEMEAFINDLSAHQYNVLKNLDELTATDLNPDIVKLLFITAPASAYSPAELTAIGNYVKAGGSLWLSGMADYSTGSQVADRENAIVAAIETQTGATINMRFNDDEVLDGNDNNGYPWGVYWHVFPAENTTGIGVNVEKMTSWSVASLVRTTGQSGTPLTADTPGVQIVVQGDLQTGYTGSYHDPNHTTNEDSDNGNDAYIYNPGWLDPWAEVPADAVPVPMAAVSDLGEQGGRIMLYGDSNDAFNKYAYVAGDGLQNELFNLEAVMWLMGEPLQKSTIAEARAQTVLNQPDNLDKLVWVEGTITAAYGEFFNMMVVQDETGGISVHAPAGDIDAAAFSRGTKVRVVGTVGIYNGDTEIEFFEAEMVQVLEPGTEEPAALPMSTYEASLEENQGWLSVIRGRVTSKVGEDNIYVDDGSGPVRVFLDGYNGDFSDVAVGDLVQVTGLVSEDGEGGRIRVRNHLMHLEYPDDVLFLQPIYLPIIAHH